MCGRFNTLDTQELRELLQRLGVQALPEFRRDICPGQYAHFVIERNGERQLLNGMWSLLIEPRPSGVGFRPKPKYSTLNARSDNLMTLKSWRERYPRQRAIVPATAFHEWRDGQCYAITQPGAVAFGSLYELWPYGEQLVPAFSIITVPPHPKLSHIHEKSLPLLLEPGDFDTWLSPEFSHVDDFADLLQPRLRRPLLVTPVDSPKGLNPVGETEFIAAD
ncbi:SOS response-associated peptidase [Crenobacter cavernae]|uniref:Abasic site processing protein n=2 Tax=Crenobacter cavernae TaxID=2290923 RepID=A0A345YA21_9NEIS|nr:SOS response-associated peptidase [Crenobacter cavernae]